MTNYKRGGFIAPYSSTSATNDYILYNGVTPSPSPAPADTPVYVPPQATGTFPGMTGGTKRRGGKTTDANYNMELNNGFLYSLQGGCACNAVTGGARRGRKNNRKKGGDNNERRIEDIDGRRRGGNHDKSKKGGVNVALAPFISTLALLGARLISDKNSGINLFGNEKMGGDTRRKYRK